jgi:rod shape-determining protein MreC
VWTLLELRSGLRLAIVAVGLVAVALVSMVVDGRRVRSGGELSWWTGAALDVAAPVQRMMSTPVDVLHDLWVDYVDLLGVRSQNQELRSRLAELSDENLQLREALVASGRLERIAEMRESYEMPMLPGELVGADASPWFRSVLIDHGRHQGVRSGMPVISEDGLVGLVRSTSTGASKAMLLLDRQSAVDGILQRSRLRGIVRGLGHEELEFEFVARGADVEVGDMVMTSGVGGVYPKGLRIGEVAALGDADSSLLRSATLKPAVDFARLEQVFVMLRRGPTLELLYGSEEAAPASGPSAP